MTTTLPPFDPSCGTESLLIYDLCETCERDRASWQDNRPEDGCPILAVFGMLGRHPAVRWQSGQVKCLKYVEAGQPVPKEDTETLPLFGNEKEE